MSTGLQMAERSPIVSGKIDHQKIGYIEGAAAFDLLGNKRCEYNPSTGNLLELGSGRTIGHVSLAGYFVGSSWIAEELFPQPSAQNSPTTSPDKPGPADFAGLVISPDKAVTVEAIAFVSPDGPVTADLIASVTSTDKVVTGEFTALVTSPDMPVATGAVALATSIDEANAADSAAPNASFHEPTAAGPAASFKAFSQELTRVGPAAPLTTSLEDTAALDTIVSATSPDEPAAAAPPTENLLSIDMEQQLNEMI